MKTTLQWRHPQNYEELNNENEFKNEPHKWRQAKNENDLKYEDELKNESSMENDEVQKN